MHHGCHTTVVDFRIERSPIIMVALTSFRDFQHKVPTIIPFGILEMFGIGRRDKSVITPRLPGRLILLVDLDYVFSDQRLQ